MNNQVKPVFLKEKKERAIINRHPWIFSGAIHKMDDSIAIGDAVCVKDHQGNPLALGHWCADDGLVIRIVSFDTTTQLDNKFFRERFFSAAKLRKSFHLPNQNTTGFRLIHGEGDGLSGLVCDVFNNTASIELSNKGFTTIINELADFLVEEYGIKHVFFIDNTTDTRAWLRGQNDDQCFLEHGLTFFADVNEGQKTGHFLDQRDNRAFLKDLSLNKRVLDAFCYSGGFSVYALHGQAKTVVSVDISPKAIELAQKNVRENKLSERHSAITADCFSYLRTIKKDEFNLIVLDPPAFAKSAHAVERAARGYKDINLLALKAIEKGGLIFTFSCSQHIDVDLFKKIIFAAAKDSNRDVRIIKEMSQGSDHPVSVYCPQSHYLKGLVLYVE